MSRSVLKSCLSYKQEARWALCPMVTVLQLGQLGCCPFAALSCRAQTFWMTCCTAQWSCSWSGGAQLLLLRAALSGTLLSWHPLWNWQPSLVPLFSMCSTWLTFPISWLLFFPDLGKCLSFLYADHSLELSTFTEGCWGIAAMQWFAVGGVAVQVRKGCYQPHFLALLITKKHFAVYCKWLMNFIDLILFQLSYVWGLVSSYINV